MTMCLHIKAIKNFQLLLQTKSQNESLVVFFLLFLLLRVFIEWSLGVFHVHVLNFTFIYQFYSRLTNKYTANVYRALHNGAYKKVMSKLTDIDGFVQQHTLQISIGWLSVISSVIPLALIGFYL